MAVFEIKCNRITDFLSDEDRIARTLSSYEEAVDRIGNNLCLQGASRQYIRGLLGKASSKIARESGAAYSLKRALSQSVQSYQNTENRICQKVGGGNPGLNIGGLAGTAKIMEEVFRNIPWLPDGIWPALGPFHTGYPMPNSLTAGFLSKGYILDESFADDLWKALFISVTYPTGLLGVFDAYRKITDLLDKTKAGYEAAGREYEYSFISKGSLESEDLNDGVEDFFKKKGLYDSDTEGGYFDKDGNFHEYGAIDKEGNEIKKESIGKVGNATILDEKVSVSTKIWEDEKVGENYEYESSVDLLKAEAYASAYGGLYSVGPDGEKQLMLGVGGAVGASVTAFEVSGSGEVGTDMLGLYGSAGVSAGKVGAEASVDAAVFDKDGNFNPKLRAGGSVEAIVAEASVSGGVQVAGTKVGGQASVNFGVGAHAEVGYSDGKFSFDVGASLGIGVSLSAEIDISGTLDAVSGFAESAWTEVTDWFKW